MALSSTPVYLSTVTCLRGNVSGKQVAGLRNNDTANALSEFAKNGMYGGIPSAEWIYYKQSN